MSIVRVGTFSLVALVPPVGRVAGFCTFPHFCASSSFSTFWGAACVSLFALVDCISKMWGASFSSNSLAISCHCFVVIFFVCFLVISSLSSELDGSSIPRFFFFYSILLKALFCSLEGFATSLFLPFPLWSRTGQDICFIPKCLQKCRMHCSQIPFLGCLRDLMSHPMPSPG